MGKDQQIIAITEYRPEDYPAIYALGANGGGMEKTFDQWKKLSDAAVAEYRAKGFEVVRVLVDPEEFRAWLAAENLKSTAESRARFGHHLASRKLTSN